jgi:hypothetical protein
MKIRAIQRVLRPSIARRGLKRSQTILRWRVRLAVTVKATVWAGKVRDCVIKEQLWIMWSCVTEAGVYWSQNASAATLAQSLILLSRSPTDMT